MQGGERTNRYSRATEEVPLYYAKLSRTSGNLNDLRRIEVSEGHGQECLSESSTFNEHSSENALARPLARRKLQ